eukprot:CAMPEP_0115363434 /NCGR_PEP_ID=MMETSP0270-20121206/103236_1 /TAXON_ID=71861 /ORGANISM="Scrippsiella trochoidea, Strain CCMP3099" /LENGTH=43 /DNA_ID= /DNA_START= /DNA_END= /DNA_ORIENTATION=
MASPSVGNVASTATSRTQAKRSEPWLRPWGLTAATAAALAAAV